MTGSCETICAFTWMLWQLNVFCITGLSSGYSTGHCQIPLITGKWFGALIIFVVVLNKLLNRFEFLLIQGDMVPKRRKCNELLSCCSRNRFLALYRILFHYTRFPSDCWQIFSKKRLDCLNKPWNIWLPWYRNVVSRILHRSFAVSDSDGMAMYSMPRPVPNLPQRFQFPVLKRKECVDVWQLMSICVA